MWVIGCIGLDLLMLLTEWVGAGPWLRKVGIGR